MPSPTYDQTYYRSRESWPDFRMEAVELVRLAKIRPEARVLEVGCGSGELLRRLAAQARLAVGVDLSEEGLQLARARIPDASCTLLVRAGATDLPFEAASFDAVVAQHLLEHLPDPIEGIREWRRVLRPGGLLALVTPNALFPDPSLFHDSTHVSIQTPDTLVSTLQAAGFQMTHLSTLFPYLGRSRASRALSIRLAPFARHLPAFTLGGRSLVAAAVG